MKYALRIALFLCLFALIPTLSAFAAVGGIIDGFQQSTLLDQDLNNDTFDDVINWKPTNGTPVVVSDTELTGTIWGQTIGWINLNPSQAGVTNDGAGVLGGYAWGQNAGWINFAPSQAGVFIDVNTGEFSGDAWSQNYGWIHFECPGVDTGADADSDADTCVKTDWTPDGGTTGGSGGSGGSGGNGSSTTSGSGGTGPQLTTGTTGGSGGTGGSTGGSGGSSSGGASGGSGGAGGGAGGGTGGGSGGSSGRLVTGGSPFPDLTSIQGFRSFVDWIRTTNLPLAFQVIALLGLAASFPSIGIRLANALLGFLGFRKKNQPWGIVYDAVTKQPLDPAYVTVVDIQGNEIASAITDLDGRYSFLLEPGTYMIRAGKTHYAFPSKLMAGKTEDQIYNNLYFGQQFTISERGQVITHDIPMDPEGADWNEAAKKSMGVFSFFSRSDVTALKIIHTLFFVGLALSIVMFVISPVLYNAIILGLYIIIVLLELFGLAPATPGSLKNSVGIPLAYAIVRVWNPDMSREVAHRVADKDGRYFILIGKGDYKITIDARNPDATYTRVFTSPLLHVTKGVINRNFSA